MSDILAFDIDSYMMGLVRIDLDPEEKARRLIARITTVDIAAQTTITRKLIVLATFDCGATPEGIEKDALTQPGQVNRWLDGNVEMSEIEETGLVESAICEVTRVHGLEMPELKWRCTGGSRDYDTALAEQHMMTAPHPERPMTFSKTTDDAKTPANDQ